MLGHTAFWLDDTMMFYGLQFPWARRTFATRIPLGVETVTFTSRTLVRLRLRPVISTRWTFASVTLNVTRVASDAEMSLSFESNV